MIVKHINTILLMMILIIYKSDLLHKKLRNVFNDDNIVQGDLQDLYTHNSPLSVDYGRLSCYLYSALKKSIEYIEDLKNDNEELKTNMIDLQKEIIDVKNEIINVLNILNNKLVIIE